jgi:hypothetical protein
LTYYYIFKPPQVSSMDPNNRQQNLSDSGVSPKTKVKHPKLIPWTTRLNPKWILSLTKRANNIIHEQKLYKIVLMIFTPENFILSLRISFTILNQRKVHCGFYSNVRNINQHLNN